LELEIKSERIPDDDKLLSVRAEWAALVASRDRAISPSAGLAALTRELRQVNENLWRIEDEMRDCERRKNLGAPFVELARSVYKSNDRRSALKRRINERLGSRLNEEKSYAPYSAVRSLPIRDNLPLLWQASLRRTFTPRLAPSS